MVNTVLKRARREVNARLLNPVRGTGNKVECPVCGWTGWKFGPAGDPPVANRHCPGCGALDRYRLLALYLRDRTEFFEGDLDLLEFGPRSVFRRMLDNVDDVRYTGVDINPLHKPRVVVDITSAGLRSGSFDLILCIHVLEHIADDGAALRELRRLLRPGGQLVAQVPLKRDTTEEDPSASPEDRARRFGQADHVRNYGRDIVGRFEAAGLDTELVRPLDWITHTEARRCALDGDDEYFIVGRLPG